jgi:hypothetical protein
MREIVVSKLTQRKDFFECNVNFIGMKDLEKRCILMNTGMI